MVKKYIDDLSLQTAMTEYNSSMVKGNEVQDQYD